MARPAKSVGLLNLPDELDKRKKIILGELKERTLWFIKLRWWVPIAMGVGIALARWIGVEFKTNSILLLACFILFYNVFFFFLSRRIKRELGQKKYIERFTYGQVGFDYITMFFLIHFTGGVTSPFIFFFIFHITFSAIFLPHRSTYFLAAIAAVGMALIGIAEYFGWISHHSLIFQGKALDLGQQPFHTIVILGFFAGFVFIAAFSITAIMRMLEKRILNLAELTETVTTLNEKLNALYTMTQAIGSKQHLEQVLNIVCSELARVMDVQAISVKLLSEDGKFLHFAASHGLPPEFQKDRVVEVAKSPLNHRIIEGEPFVTGRVTQRESFQFGEDLEAVQLQSVQFVPLVVEAHVIGILGAYSNRPEQFGPDELIFFRQAAGLVAIAIENARAYETIETSIQERTKFMNRAAHNLRAPLVAITSMLEVIQNGYLGDINDEVRKQLRRIDQRVQNMLLMINELMILAKSQSRQRQLEYRSLNLKVLADQIYQTFQERAVQKRLSFKVTVPEDLPDIRGDQEMVEQMLENLVSNAIKYTPEEGRVGMTFWSGSDGTVRIVLSDSGIGIPKEEIPRLFTEFFRASNVKDVIGTGLGLTIVKEIVDQHGGQIQVESEEGLGTTFVIHLPLASEETISY
jgi:signal transduction histidine kinase